MIPVPNPDYMQTVYIIFFSLAMLSQAVAMYFTWRVKSVIDRVEVNTNSIRDQLVATTAKLSHAEGKVEGKIEQAQETGTVVNAATPNEKRAAKTNKAKITTLNKKIKGD